MSDPTAWAIRAVKDEARADLIANLRAYIKLVYPGEMTPHAKRILEQILDAQIDGDPAVYPDGTHVRDLIAEAEAGDASDYG